MSIYLYTSGMKKGLSLLSIALLLGGCNTSPVENVNYKVPIDCNQQVVIDAFNDLVPGSRFVPTEWQPAADTDLDAVLKNNGIACSYGIETAEIGGTVMWAENKNDVWENRVNVWKKSGQIKIDLPGIDETEAYVLQEGSTSADEMHVWGVNLLVGDIWIQLNATFLQNLDEAVPLIRSAISAAQE